MFGSSRCIFNVFLARKLNNIKFGLLLAITPGVA
jgi:hypothetical protein